MSLCYQQVYQTNDLLSSSTTTQTCNSLFLQDLFVTLENRGMEIEICIFWIPFRGHKRTQTISNPVRQCGDTGELIFCVAYT